MRSFFGSVLIVACVAVCASPLGAQEIEVRAEVESRDVYMGESFIMQIIVDGSEKAKQPDFSALEGFGIEFVGGSNNSSQSISIINGRMQRTVIKSYIFTYRLTPREPGRLTIPSLTVEVEGKRFATEPVTIAVRRPAETEEFKLRMRLSKETCYVGEPVLLDVTWYIRRDVENFRFTAPLFDNDAFTFENPDVKIDQRKKYYRIPIGGGEVIAEKGQGLLKGESYATLSFSKAIIPNRSGTFVLPEIIVECEAAVGTTRRRDFFDDFFRDDFFNLRRGRLKKYVVPSNRLSLRVVDLPVEGKPPGFAGHVGEYRLTASAEPTEVSIGDPITLTIVLEGSDYLGGVDLPPLSEQEELTAGFKIPDERADGRIEGKKKVFTQTIRALDEGVTEIPPIELAYFDTKTGTYEIARSNPVPITVEATKVVTAQDAEGIVIGPVGEPVEEWKEGIAYNYEGPAVVIPQDFGIVSALADPMRVAAFILPPAVYFILLGAVVAVRRRRADPEARRTRGALKRLRSRLDRIARDGELSHAELCGGVMEALREYLGDKLRRTGATLTAVEVESIMRDRGVSEASIESVREILGTCEAGAYAGGITSAGDREDLIAKVRETARKLDKEL